MNHDYMERGEQVFYKTYNRFPVVFLRGEGVYLYDDKGERYLDFAAGIAVNSLGYGDPEYTKAIKDQADTLLHTSNLFYNMPSVEAGEKLLEASQMDKVFFTNSGTEAIEGAIKIAKKYGFNKDHKPGHEIIAMNHSFHGRSLGALSVTGNPHYQEPFAPLLPGIRFADYNDIDSVKAQITDKTCGIILETIQGEGGIYPATQEFLKAVRELCDQHDILLILDEIQCGMGRTGHMFAWQGYGVKPDVMTTAKALGNGVPIGAFLACNKAATAMVPGDHGTTYGGNPFACRGACKVLEIFKERDLVSHVNQIAPVLQEGLEALKKKHDCIVEWRGKGLMLGLELTVPVAPIITKALTEEKLVVISAGEKIIRMVPPLVIEEAHVKDMLERLERVLP